MVILNTLKDEPISRVFLPGLICPCMIDVVKHAGLNLKFYDLAENSLFPSTEQLLDVQSDDLLVVAPYFGIVPSDLQWLRNIPAKIILDFAQAPGSTFEGVSPYASFNSFGIGKGVDYYGGALLPHESLIINTDDFDHESKWQNWSNTIKNSLKRFILSNTILYRLCRIFIFNSFENLKYQPEPLSPTCLNKKSQGEILQNYISFANASILSKKRIQKIYAQPSLQRFLFSLDSINIKQSSFLRFPILAKDSIEADHMIKFFYQNNIELTYGREENSNLSLPNLSNLQHRLLKLTFLGSLTKRQFNHLLQVFLQYEKEKHAI